MFKKLYPHLAAVGIFALLTIAYFMPYYQGMTLQQGDVTQWEGMSKEIIDWNEQHPDEPALWTGRMFGGMPAFQISMLYAGNYVNKIVHAVQVFFPDAAALLFMMFAGFYILLLCFDVKPWVALGGAIAYGLSSFILISIEAGHNTKVQAMSLMAPALGGVILAYRKNILVGAAITALFLSMAIDANHLQVAYYLLLTLGFIAIYYFVESILQKTVPHFFKASVALLAAGLLAIAPNVGNLWSTQEYAKDTIRGGASELTQKKAATAGGGLDFDYATRWSYGFTDGEILSILIPNIKGGGSSSTVSESNPVAQQFMSKGYQLSQVGPYVASISYWGNQPFTSGPVYFGAAIVFLFVFSLFIVENRIKWVLLALTIFSFLLSFGHNTPFFKLLFDTLPFFNKFRTPAMALVIAELTIPLLAILGVHELLKSAKPKEHFIKPLQMSAGITAGLVVVFGIIGSYMYGFSGANDTSLAQQSPELIPLLKQSRAEMLRSDSFVSLFFILSTAAIAWFFVQKKVSQTLFVVLLTFVFLIDGWHIAKRYLNSENFVEKSTQNNHAPTQADLDILRDTDPNFRVFNVTRDPFNDAMTSYYHKSVGGYHAAKLIRYQDLIENQISKNNINVLNMLNTKYVIVENPETKAPVAQRNPDALGNAWLVNDIKWVKNADEEMSSLTSFNPRQTVVIDERYKSIIGTWQASGDSSAAIRQTLYSPNKLAYEYNAAAPQLAVFSEIYYNEEKGWHAYLDGNKVPHARANYVLRAMTLPAGKHQIEFKFEPQSVVAGSKIALAGSLLLFLFVFGTLGYSGYQKLKEEEANAATEKPKAATKKSK